MPKSMTIGWVCRRERDHHIGRFDIPVDDPFLVGVLNGLADGNEQLEALFGGKLVLVAILGDRHALNQFHDKIGPAAIGGAAIEHLGDVGVVHQSQGLALGLEAGDDVAGVHAQLDDLKGDLAADRFLLLSHIHHAHAALANLLQQLVAADE
jgi:hypothetical protein